MKRRILVATLLALGATTLTASGDTAPAANNSPTPSAEMGTTSLLLDSMNNMVKLPHIPAEQMNVIEAGLINLQSFYKRIMNAAMPPTTPNDHAATPPADKTSTSVAAETASPSVDPMDIILTLANKVKQNKELTATMESNLLNLKSAYQHTTGVAVGVVNGAVCNLSQIVNLPEQNKINPEVYDLATTAYMCAIKSGMDSQRILTVVDYTLPSTEKRLWVFDLNQKRVLFNSYVAHGKGSGAVMAQTFSDQPDTHASSIGLFLTGNVYRGHDGYSLKLYGLEQGFNDKAFEREIVIHGAPYVSEQRAKAGGLGRSWGCLALPLNEVQKIIDTVKQGSLIFSYYPDQKWLNESKFLHCMHELNKAAPTPK